MVVELNSSNTLRINRELSLFQRKGLQNGGFVNREIRPYFFYMLPQNFVQNEPILFSFLVKWLSFWSHKKFIKFGCLALIRNRLHAFFLKILL